MRKCAQVEKHVQDRFKNCKQMPNPQNINKQQSKHKKPKGNNKTVLSIAAVIFPRSF
jgi:hypothetical protein